MWHDLKGTEESLTKFSPPHTLTTSIIIPPLDIYLCRLSNFSLGQKTLLWRQEFWRRVERKGPFWDMGSKFQRNSLNGESQRRALGNQRPAEGMEVLWREKKSKYLKNVPQNSHNYRLTHREMKQKCKCPSIL